MKRLISGTLSALVTALVLFTAQPSAAGAPVNVNTATAAELMEIKGIGPAKAQAIVEHREKHGPFKTVDDLKLVRGIGDKMLEQLRSQVSVGAGGDVKPPAAKQ